MLSLWKLRVGAEAYYLSQVARGLDDYYTGQGEMPGRWLGNATSALGLSGVVTGEDLRAVMAGLNPGTGQTPNGERLRVWRNRVPGFDLTFSAPKSVSVLYALADPLVRGHVVEALDAAVDDALGWLEREACFVRRGSNNRAAQPGDPDQFGTRRLHGAGFVAAGFRHRTSRAGDPQLHTHVLVANMTRGPDRRWSALDAYAIYRSQRACGPVFDAALRAELTRRLGVAWVPTGRDSFEIAGIPRGMLRLFSKRRAEIEAEMDRIGVSGAKAAEQVTLQTRTGKLSVDGDGLDARWVAEAATVGFGPADVDRLLAGTVVVAAGLADRACPLVVVSADPDTGAQVERVVNVERFAARVAETLVERDSTFTRHQVTAGIAQMLSSPATTVGLERLTDLVLGQPDLVPLPLPAEADGGWEQRWTSRRLLTVEAELLAALQPRPGGCGVLNPSLVAQVLSSPRLAGLGDDQLDTVRRVTTQGLTVEVVVGRAGTGKTFAMNAVRAVYEEAGYRVVGIAPSGLAARGLNTGAAIPSYTFPRFAWHAASTLTAGDVIVVDEAGMAGTVELHWVISAAGHAGAKVILVGDHHQLPEVVAGGGFAAAVAATVGYTAELTVNRRQAEPWEITALDELRHGDAAAAFTAYHDHGRVIVHDQLDELRTAAIDQWWDAYRSGGDALLLAGTRAAAHALNRDGKARAAAEGLLHGPVLEVHGRRFQAGDRVILTRNDGHQRDLDQRRWCQVDNGMIGTIEHVDTATGGVDVRLTSGRRIRLDRDYLAAGHLDHGYAVTVHKAQGVTCDYVFVVGPHGLYREAVYVALSRARLGAWIFATSRDAALFGERHHTTGIRLPSETDEDPEADLLAALHASHAKQLATVIAPHLAAITDLATTTSLDVLWARQRQIGQITGDLRRAGHRDPTVEAELLTRARTHRQYLQIGGRVRALDWDNVGTVITIADHNGTCQVQFVADDGRIATKWLPWSDTKPIDHPARVDLPDTAIAHFTSRETALAQDVTTWNHLLDAHGIAADDPIIVPAGIDHRRRQLRHRLAGDPPEWLDWWLGPRPRDPAGAQVWDDEVAAMAAWRDARHLGATTPGYGPPPVPEHAERWRQHLHHSLDVHLWLRAHRPGVDPDPVVPLDAAETRRRLEQLDAILATAPADQTPIIHALLAGNMPADDLHLALSAAHHSQAARRDWILEHWPHVVEHAELSRFAERFGPLDHWPIPLPPAAQPLLEALTAISSDTPEPRTLLELDRQIDDADPRRQARVLTDQLAQLRRTIQLLRDERHRLADRPDLVANLNDHLDELRDHHLHLADQKRRHDAKEAMWTTGHRPRELAAGLNRRSNHLAHTAITQREPWVVETVRTYHDHHSAQQDVAPLYRLVTELAALRERSGHTGSDPLGPPPDPNHPQHATWQHLHDQLHTTPAPRISDVLGGRGR
jgi:conjugative relaxase-like TrwC/TraI family protein